MRLQSSLHFLVNMLAFSSCGPPAFDYLSNQRFKYPWVTEEGRVMNWHSTYHHIAWYVTAAILADLIPHYIRLLCIRPQMNVLMARVMRSPFISAKTQFTAERRVNALIRRRIHPSLGASGAIYSCVFLSAFAYPDMKIFLLILPFYSIPIQYGVAGIAALDAMGIIRGWQLFDHWAHLTGGVFGGLSYYCEPQIWYYVQKIMEGGRKQ